MDSKTLFLVLAVLVVNISSRFYGFWIITSQASPRQKGRLFWPAISLQLLVPISLPSEYPILKFLLLCNTCLHVFKLIDYYHRYESLSERDRNFKRFFHFFECLYTADIRKSFLKVASTEGILSPLRGGNREGLDITLRLALPFKAMGALGQGVVYLALGMVFLTLNRRFGWWAAFGGTAPLDYVTLAVEYYLICVGLVNTGVGLHRRMGYKVEGFFSEPLRAGSPGEFWARWNIPVHEWLKDNVYKKFGGRRHPYRGLFATFLASGLFHEYIISLATNTLNGFMVAYFMTQFLLVVLSISLHRLLDSCLPVYARVRLTRPFQGMKWSLTVCCVLLPVPLFIHNFEKIFPLHTW
jgi:hypothetical protein